MKRKRIFRIFSLAVILSLLVLAVPALPALAYNYNTSIDPDSGEIGDPVDIEGNSFNPSTETTERWAMIVFSEDEANEGDYIDEDVVIYENVDEATIGYEGDDDEGDFSTSFDVPSRLTDGEDDANVSSGTYYICVAVLTDLSESPYRIYAVEEFEVTGAGGDGTISLSPTSGKAGTDVTVSGSDFTGSKTITLKYDSTTLTRKSGDSSTDSSGDFDTVVTIPATATAGTHTIYATVSGETVSDTFTVTASAALNALSPATGKAGSDVTVSGTNFLVSYPIIFKFDTTTITPKSGDTNTSTTGSFSSVITIPQGAAASAHTISVTVGTATVTAQFTVTASAALNALSPATGKAGSDVTVSGTNFMVSYPIIFKFESSTLTPKSGDVNTSTTGSFTSVITIPPDATAGAHDISVTVGTVTVTAQFTVSTAPPPTPTPTPTSKAVLSINQSGNTVGSLIGIGGAGFTSGADVTVKYDDILVTTIKADADGLVMVTFKAPPSKGVDHIITLSDGKNSATTKFAVETKAPPIPPPLLPEMGEKVKSPITFDWTDVTDDSSPVTYTFQIATDKTFATGSIVLEKKALDKSEFTFTETTELKLESQATPYYWRVKAVDAAFNESAWTTIGEFYVGAGFSFPKWALYLIIAVAAVFLFFIGFWIGRRTAFYY